jgi:REP element-mobilizing transposase RayT
MGRVKRSHLPGVAFHITARAQDGEPIFTGLEAAVVSRILEHTRFADVLLLAYGVMPNHFHLVIVQGTRPLASLMQPLMRHLALLVINAKDRRGHMFEGPYRDVACLKASHLRNSLAYVHLNGCRAGLCEGVEDFAWCSHHMMCAAADTCEEKSRTQLGMETSLRMFAANHGQTMHACRDDYHAFVRWRVEMDRYLAAGGSADRGGPPAPCTYGGDAFWLAQFGKSTPSAAEARIVRSLPNLRDMALTAIEQIAPGMELEDLRCGSRGRAAVRVRRHLVARAIHAGHSPLIVARFLNISRTTISSLLHRSGPAR